MSATATVSLPTPLSIVKKPGARSSYLLTGPLGRHVALAWSPLEAEVLALRANAHDGLVATLEKIAALPVHSDWDARNRAGLDLAIREARTALAAVTTLSSFIVQGA